MCCHLVVSVTVTMVVDLDVGMCRRERMRQGERVSGMCKASEKSLFLAYIPLRAFLIAALTSSKYVLDENQC